MNHKKNKLLNLETEIKESQLGGKAAGWRFRTAFVGGVEGTPPQTDDIPAAVKLRTNTPRPLKAHLMMKTTGHAPLCGELEERGRRLGLSSLKIIRDQRPGFKVELTQTEAPVVVCGRSHKHLHLSVCLRVWRSRSFISVVVSVSNLTLSPITGLKTTGISSFLF